MNLCTQQGRSVDRVFHIFGVQIDGVPLYILVMSDISFYLFLSILVTVNVGRAGAASMDVIQVQALLSIG